MSVDIAHLEELSEASVELAGLTTRSERRLRAVATAALAVGRWEERELPDLSLLGEVRQTWKLAIVKTTSQRRLVWKFTDRRAVLRLVVDVVLSPTPLGSGPTAMPPRAVVALERPSLLLPATAERLRRWVPGVDAKAEDTVLLDLAALGVLAVRRPDYLLGWFPRAKLWLDGQPLKPSQGRWPMAPFIELARQLSAWLSGDGAVQGMPVDGSSEEVLPQVVAEIVRAHQLLQSELAQAAASHGAVPSPLAELQADYVLKEMRADLALRLDTAGDLSDAEDHQTVVLGLQLLFDPSLLRSKTVAPSARLRLRPPEFLASGKVLEGLLESLRDDAVNWRRDLDVSVLRQVLARAAQMGTVALRTGRQASSERWVLFLPADRQRQQLWVLRADFERQPPADGAEGLRLTGKVQGRRAVLYDPTRRRGGDHFDDDVVRAFLRLITALWRYGLALF